MVSTTRVSILALCMVLLLFATTGCSGNNTKTKDVKKASKPPIMTKAEYLKQVKAVGLSKYADALERLCLNSMVISCSKVDEAKMELGQSKIGGKPDLPKNMKWPDWKGQPLSFIAQIRLSDITKLDIKKDLPATGILYFFYDANQEAWGYDPADKGRSKVIYYQGDLRDLNRMSYPNKLSIDARFKARSLSFKSQTSYAPWESIAVKKLDMSKVELSSYQDLLLPMDAYWENHPIHRLMGHPTIIQDEMQTECQLVTNGLYCGDETGYEDPRVEKLIKDAGKWRLLLQIDSEESAGMMWGDAGRLYFWIPEDALRNRDFEKIWTILQCY